MAKGYRYGISRTGFGKQKKPSLRGFIGETIRGGITGGITSAAFYGAGKGIEKLWNGFQAGKGGTGVGKIWNYSKQFDDELNNFNGGYKIKNVIDKDLFLVQFHSDAQIGEGRSLKYWTTFDEVNGISTIDDYMNKMALLSSWGARNNISIAKIPAGTKIKYAIGTAKKQISETEFRPGGGLQLLFEYFDDGWVIDTRSLP